MTFNMSGGQHSNQQLPADSCESRMTMIKTKVKLIDRAFAQGLCSSLFVVVIITFTTAVLNARG